MSYKVEMKADETGNWIPNGMTFASHDEAYEYGMDLWARWGAVTDMRVVESENKVNYSYANGRLVPVTFKCKAT